MCDVKLLVLEHDWQVDDQLKTKSKANKRVRKVAKLVGRVLRDELSEAGAFGTWIKKKQCRKNALSSVVVVKPHLH